MKLHKVNKARLWSLCLPNLVRVPAVTLAPKELPKVSRSPSPRRPSSRPSETRAFLIDRCLASGYFDSIWSNRTGQVPYLLVFTVSGFQDIHRQEALANPLPLYNVSVQPPDVENTAAFDPSVSFVCTPPVPAQYSSVIASS